MKKYTTILALAALSIPFVANAEGDKKPGGDDAKRKAHRAAVLEKYDTDKDGKLSKEERKAGMEAWKKEALAKYDTDKDGELSKEERKAMHKDGVHPPFGKHDRQGKGRKGPKGGKKDKPAGDQ